jgi:hypothetical protein
MNLRDLFYLEEHPFDPDRDPVSNFDFRGQRVALTRGLELFRFSELQRFYSRVGAFGVAAASARKGVIASGYPLAGGYSPVALIFSSQGQGFSSLASFVASVVRDAAPNPKPVLQRQPVASDHFGKALYLIAKQLLAHLQGAGSMVADQLKDGLSSLKPEDPDEPILLSLLGSLSGDVGNTVPPLLLVLEKISYSRRDWPERLHRILNGFNVMLICHTDDPRVPPFFQRDVSAARYPGFLLTLDGLTREEALAFLRERLSLFRSQAAPAEKTGLYPFLEAEVNSAFTGQDRLKISLLIFLLSGRFRQKLDELQAAPAAGSAPPATSAPSTATVSATYRSAIRNVAATPGMPPAAEHANDPKP